MMTHELTKNPAVGTKVRINGRRTVFTVVKSSDMGFDLRGPRGGCRAVVRNIHRADDLTMIDMGSMSARAERVETIEVVA